MEFIKNLSTNLITVCYDYLFKAVTIGDGEIKSILKKKSLVRTSFKPMGHKRPESVIEEALRSPLPSGPAPKKPPRSSSLLRNDVDGNLVMKNNPLMVRSMTETCLQRGPNQSIQIRRNNSFPSTSLERSTRIIMNRNGTLTRVELRHVYHLPSGEVNLISFFSVC